MQYAAAERSAPGSYYEELTATFTARDVLAAALERLGFEVNRPAGGYFIPADHRGVSEPLGLTTDVEVCHHLIQHAGVATILPTAFYDHKQRGQHLLRCVLQDAKTIGAAVQRLRSWHERASDMLDERNTPPRMPRRVWLSEFSR